MYSDSQSWYQVHNEDAWIFDKLILSRRMGYICGPHGIDVPKPGRYIVRPVVNIEGMSRKARFIEIEKHTDDLLEPGEFWCEVFTGRHLSVDYIKGNQVLCVEGLRDPNDPIWKWSKWVRTDDQIEYPSIMKSLRRSYPYVNVEMIGGRVIEIHLRLNPNWESYDGDEIIPVFDDCVEPLNGYRYVESEEYHRRGFFQKIG